MVLRVEVEGVPLPLPLPLPLLLLRWWDGAVLEPFEAVGVGTDPANMVLRLCWCWWKALDLEGDVSPPLAALRPLPSQCWQGPSIGKRGP